MQIITDYVIIMLYNMYIINSRSRCITIGGWFKVSCENTESVTKARTGLRQ